MNEFKFSCPHCQQNIQATPEYAGLEINCPSCQTAMVVPHPPESGAPAPKPGGKLSKAPSTVQHAATSPVMATTMVRKAKKPRIGLYVGLGVGAVAIAAGIYFAPKLMDKYHEHKDKVLAEQAATNAPPPPPPELTADEILKKIDATYKGLSSYSAQAASLGTIDMSAINPMLKEPLHPTTKLSILMARGSRYRMEWDRQAGPQSLKGAAWSTGKGDFIRTGTSTRKVKNREEALNTAGAMSGALGVGLAELFFNQTNSLTVMLKNYSKTNNETVNGRKCYVLTGQAGPQNVVIWVRKDDFLIAQAKMILGGKIDDSAMSGMTAAQKAQVKQMEKIKGNILETYEDIETNQDLNPEDFKPGAAAAAKHKKPQEGAAKKATAEDDGGGQRKAAGVAGLAPE